MTEVDAYFNSIVENVPCPFVITGPGSGIVVGDNDGGYDDQGGEFDAVVQIWIRDADTIGGIYLDRQETQDLVTNLLARLAA